MNTLQSIYAGIVYENLDVPTIPKAGQEIYDLMSETDVNKVDQKLDKIFVGLPKGTYQNAKEICQDYVLIEYGLVKSRKTPHNVQMNLMTIEGGKAHILKIAWLYNQPATEWEVYDIGPAKWIRNRKDDKDFKYVIATKELFNDLVKLTEKITTKRTT